MSRNIKIIANNINNLVDMNGFDKLADEFIKALTPSVDNSEPDRIFKLIDLHLKTIKNVSDELKQAIWIQKVAEKYGINQNIIIRKFKELK
jgi:hypothetical protein